MATKKQKQEEVVEEGIEETGADLFDQEVGEAQSLADLAGTAGGGSFEGDKVSMEAIKDRKHMLLDFKTLPSTFRDGEMYIVMQIKLGGKLYVVQSNAKVILKLANADKSKLPLPNAFVMRQPAKPGGKPYWDLAHTDELAAMK